MSTPFQLRLREDRPATIDEHRELRQQVAALNDHVAHLQSALRQARAWFLRPENQDLSGSDEVFIAIDAVLWSKHHKPHRYGTSCNFIARSEVRASLDPGGAG